MYKYSEGKENNTESTGRFGTGFLTTHSLSKEVAIQGDIQEKDKIVGFQVTMHRSGKTQSELLEGLIKSQKEKKLLDTSFGTTSFTYNLVTKRNHESSILGVSNFIINIVYTMLFNPKFGVVKFSTRDGNQITANHTETTRINKSLRIETFQVSGGETTNRSFLIQTIDEYSELLSQEFKTKRNLKFDGCIELVPINDPSHKYKITFNAKAPCLFCSLPLVGSESHIFPIILNSNDFEPGTERQEIILDAEKTFPVQVNQYILQRSFEIYENIVEYCSSNHFQHLYVLSRGLKNVPVVKKYFDPKWYLDNYMKPMREIFMKYEVVLTSQGFKKIQDVFFPIYPTNQISPEYQKEFYDFVKVMYESVPTFDDSLNWSVMLWDVPKHLIKVSDMLKKFSKMDLSLDKDKEFINSFIKFAWENHKSEINQIPILINQNNDFVKYDESFSGSIGVSKNLVDCLEELGANWKATHLHESITSITLPVIDDINIAFSIIRDRIKDNFDNALKFVQYVLNGNSKREEVHHFASILFPTTVQKKIYLENIDSDMWDLADNMVISKMIEKIAKLKDLSNIQRIKNYDHLRFLKFINNYSNVHNVFNHYSLIPNALQQFKKKDELYSFVTIPMELVNLLKDTFQTDVQEIILHSDYIIPDIQFFKQQYSIKSIASKINTFISSHGNKSIYARRIIKFIPKESDEEAYQNQMELFEKYKVIQQSKKAPVFIDYCPELYKYVNKNIILFIVEKLSNLKNIQEFAKICRDPFDYINGLLQMFDKYQINGDTFSIIPNEKGNFLSINQLYYDNGITPSLKKLLSTYSNINSILIDEKINKKPTKSLKNDDLVSLCNDIIDDNEEFAYKMLRYISKDNESTQRKIIELIKYFGHSIPETEYITISSDFWKKANSTALNNVLSTIKQCHTLDDLISQSSFKQDQESTIKILELFYEFHKPTENQDDSIILNQNNSFISYKNAYGEEQIPDKFKEMMETLFNDNVRDRLINKGYHKFRIEKTYSIEKCSNQIKSCFKEEKLRKTRSKAFIHFVPESEDGQYIQMFSECYQFFKKEPFEIIPIPIDNITLWDIPIQILSPIIISSIENQKTIDALAQFLGQEIPETVQKLDSIIKCCNSFHINLKGRIIFPNQMNQFCDQDTLYDGSTIDSEIIDISAQLCQEDIRRKLVHPDLHNLHLEKMKMETICKEIDGNIQHLMAESDPFNDEVRRAGGKELITKWLPKNEKYEQYFKYLTSTRMKITITILFEKEKRAKIESMLKKDPSKLMVILIQYLESSEPKPIQSSQKETSYPSHNQTHYSSCNSTHYSRCNSTHYSSSSVSVKCIPTSPSSMTSYSQLDSEEISGYIAEALVYEYLLNCPQYINVSWPAQTENHHDTIIFHQTLKSTYYIKPTSTHYDIMATRKENGRKCTFEVKSTINTSDQFQFFISQYQFQTLQDNYECDRYLVLVMCNKTENPRILFLKATLT